MPSSECFFLFFSSFSLFYFLVAGNESVHGLVDVDVESLRPARPQEERRTLLPARAAAVAHGTSEVDSCILFIYIHAAGSHHILLDPRVLRHEDLKGCTYSLFSEDPVFSITKTNKKIILMTAGKYLGAPTGPCQL